MSHRIAAKITGVSKYLPPRVMTNDDLAKVVDTNDEWIRTRTGIRERHVADPGVASSHLATEAAKQLLAKTQTEVAEIARAQKELAASHKELAAAQKELAAAQKELASAQKATDRSLKALIDSLRNGRNGRNGR